MTASGSVVIVTLDQSLAQLVTEVVDSTAHFACEQRPCRDLNELSAELDQREAVAVLVDLDSGPVIAELQPLIDQFLSTRFIVIASEQREDLVLEAMHAGARDFLVKSSISSTLPTILDRLSRLATSDTLGDRPLITILSAGGGCGATTLAVNLAHELHHVSGDAALLIDLESCYGGVGGYLGLSARFGIADVLADGHRIDAHLVQSTAVAYHDQLFVLVGPATTQPGWPAELKLEHLPAMLRAAREAFHHTVIDAPRVSGDVAAELARSSTLVLLVLEMNVDDIRIAQSQLEGLSSVGLPERRLLPVISRFRRGTKMMSLGAVKKALGRERILRLNNDFTSVVSSINYGKTLAEAAPRSSLRRDIHTLAEAIHTSHNGELCLEKLV